MAASENSGRSSEPAQVDLKRERLCRCRRGRVDEPQEKRQPSGMTQQQRPGPRRRCCAPGGGHAGIDVSVLDDQKPEQTGVVSKAGGDIRAGSAAAPDPAGDVEIVHARQFVRTNLAVQPLIEAPADRFRRRPGSSAERFFKPPRQYGV